MKLTLAKALLAAIVIPLVVSCTGIRQQAIEAVRHNNWTKISDYLKSINPSIVTPERLDANVLLLPAIACKQYELLDALLSGGADPEWKVLSGQTPLHMACCLKDPEAVKVLIRHKADVNALNAMNDNPVSWAAWVSNVETVKFLVSKGGDLFANDSLGHMVFLGSKVRGIPSNVTAPYSMMVIMCVRGCMLCAH